MFRLVKKGALAYYMVDSFEETGLIKHCFTTRLGGVSKPPYDELNLRFHCDDTRENVIENHRIISSAIGVDYKRLVLSKHVHEDVVLDVGEESCGNGIMYENKFTSADGLVTDKAGVPLLTVYADCVPLMFLDKKERVIANVHSGWRGTMLEIGRKAVEKMIRDYNSCPENILAAIGPSIRVCHYEVSEELAEDFRGKFGDSVVRKNSEGCFVDLQRACRDTLINAGIPEENITDSGICTYCCSDLLFSHRKTKGIRGNLAAIMELK